MSEPMAHERIEEVFRQIGAVIPPEAVRHGWNANNLAYECDRDAVGRWSVAVIGPTEAWSECLRFVGNHPDRWIVHVATGSLGRIEAGTADDLVRLVGEFFATVWGKR